MNLSSQDVEQVSWFLQTCNSDRRVAAKIDRNTRCADSWCISLSNDFSSLFIQTMNSRLETLETGENCCGLNDLDVIVQMDGQAVARGSNN